MSALVKNHSYVLKEIQMMINDDRQRSGFVTCCIAGRWVQAKVYDEPSTFGFGGNSRISKLAIGKSALCDPHKPFMDQMDFNYDRGLDFSNLSDEDVAVVVAALEKLPPASEQVF